MTSLAMLLPELPLFLVHFMLSIQSEEELGKKAERKPKGLQTNCRHITVHHLNELKLEADLPSAFGICVPEELKLQWEKNRNRKSEIFSCISSTDCSFPP